MTRTTHTATIYAMVFYAFGCMQLNLLTLVSQDIVEDDEIKLDWFFKASLVHDIVNVSNITNIYNLYN